MSYNVSAYLTCLTQNDNLEFIHTAANDIISFFLMAV